MREAVFLSFQKKKKIIVKVSMSIIIINMYIEKP